MRGFRTKEWLETVRATDTTPRLLGKSEFIEIKCSQCSNSRNVKVIRLTSAIKEKRDGSVCVPCGYKLGAAKRKTGVSPDGQSRKKAAFRSKESLEKLNLVDTTSRIIKQAELVEVKCGGCGICGQSVYNRIVNSFKDLGYGWHCGDCRKRVLSEKASAKIGELNGFYGKRHSEENKKLHSNRMKIKSLLVPLEQRQELSESMQKAYEKKHGFRNPMRHPKHSKNWQNAKSNKKNGDSKGEIQIREFVESLGVAQTKHLMFDITTNAHKEIDVFVPDKMIGIEHNGLNCHADDYKTNTYHRDKYLLAKKSGISLIQLFSNEWHYRQDQCKNFIRSKLGMNSNKIGARQAEFKWISHLQAKQFIDEFHIQPSRGMIGAIGVFYKDLLVAVTSFNYHHRDSNKEKIVLSRLVYRNDWTVHGSLSKMTQMASEHFKKDLITWSDLRFTEGKGYVAAGWEFEKALPIDYCYTDGRFVIPKQSRKKSEVGTPEDMTEGQHAEIDGLRRIYDCGKIRFVFKYKNLSSFSNQLR